MPDFRIVEIVFDNAKVYYRYETVGKSNIGGDDVPHYAETSILKHFRGTAHSRKSGPTDVENAALVASKAVGKEVQYLQGTEAQARSARKAFVASAIAVGAYQVLNDPSR